MYKGYIIYPNDATSCIHSKSWVFFNTQDQHAYPQYGNSREDCKEQIDEIISLVGEIEDSHV